MTIHKFTSYVNFFFNALISDWKVARTRRDLCDKRMHCAARDLRTRFRN